ncbi:hypothetical protein [Pseudaminobacter soli (ex Li et al. 2025)]|uniref:hypothetical protein n=1 Tax=Pseudaminobacter soli (ex Li et al. 2025) TaxID=1295366 RepID=UPI0011B23880|nr:hypothetical protein [Mesorhizobium soli]
MQQFLARGKLGLFSSGRATPYIGSRIAPAMILACAAIAACRVAPASMSSDVTIDAMYRAWSKRRALRRNIVAISNGSEGKYIGADKYSRISPAALRFNGSDFSLPFRIKHKALAAIRLMKLANRLQLSTEPKVTA